MNVLRQIYGILFVVGPEGVTPEVLAQTLKINLQLVTHLLLELQTELANDPDSPIELVAYNQNYQLVTKADLAETVEDFAHTQARSRLSRAALETLAIVAYRQPVTRMAVDEIRGVASANMLQNLIARDLIKEVGRVESPGRPVLYGTTEYFMNYFGLLSLEDLPEVQPLELEAELLENTLFNFEDWEVTMYEEDES